MEGLLICLQRIIALTRGVDDVKSGSMVDCSMQMAVLAGYPGILG
jgi:hypothetical protein